MGVAVFKMSFTVYRKPGLTREEFLDYWQNVHAPLAVEHAKALRIRRYVQMHAVESEATDRITASRQCQPPHDGVVEIWWDCEEDRLAAAATEEGRRAGQILSADELQFCDMSRATVSFGYEHLVIDDGMPVTPVRRL